MSFLSEVIATADTITLEEINKKMPTILNDIENIKSEVIQFSENISEYMYTIHQPTQKYLRKASICKDGIEKLLKDAEDLTKKVPKANTQLNKQLTTLKTYSFMSEIVKHFCEVNNSLTKVENLIKTADYVNAMAEISQANQILNSVDEKEFIVAADKVKTCIIIKENLLIYTIEQMFKENVQTESEENVHKIIVKKENEDMLKGFQTLYQYNPVINCMSGFVQFIWLNIFTPIIDHEVTVNIKDLDEFYELILHINGSHKPMYNDVFKNLKIVIDFVYNNFNYILAPDNFTLLQYIGQEMRDNLSELIIKHCLEGTIPSNASELQSYQNVIDETEKFEAYLRDTGLFTNETTSIFEYANNIDHLFINKKCQEYMITAEGFMKKDLHDMTEVGVPYDHENPFNDTNNEFSQCSISKSVLDIIELVEQIIKQALKSSDEAAGKLVYTAQNVFQRYARFVPAHHQKLLQTIPQQVALFYNNCYYISYELKNKLNKEYSSKLNAILQSEFSMFAKEVLLLESVAKEVFDTYIEGQIKQINEIMQGAGLDIESFDKVEPITEKCIRQCMRQQELLKTVWYKVLSYSIYNQTIGKIMDAFCTVIINAVVKFEDISSDGALQMIDVLKIICNRGPKLFTDPKEVTLYVKSWYKFQELNFVLNSSLIDINNRWADGKGPLALQFEPNELRQLIRALFQNTDRRAALLAKIQC